MAFLPSVVLVCRCFSELYGKVFWPATERAFTHALAGAYGIAMSWLMAITTLLAALVALQWCNGATIRSSSSRLMGSFFIIDCIFFAANSTKLLEGGWFPLVLAGAVAFVMLTWQSGAKLVEGARRNSGGRKRLARG